jgi:hypothetical protein
LEGMVLAVLVLLSWRRLLTIPRRLRAEPYTTYAVVYLLMFFFAFGTISNFGILARQRSQAMPFVFVLLSVPVAFAPTRRSPTERPSPRLTPPR